ncbi:MAG: inosine/xanthosine triphosphatase [Shewanella psychromarinicola]|jgi:inosine/xanthosine triphosphatase|uniref:inosine/xanthosine triphosphatase n=1 Tax=Shewanella TaxID=22 RepID=UPI000C32E136|nr:inosine/xanthosine triphosphatase [Shewanella sp. Actino-trap-3]PKG78671.1 non-canonical purine NTP phosphatase [Shewanella sp. Actino-trap-3]
MPTSPTIPQTLTIIVGSTNPVKISAAQHAIGQYFPDVQIHCRGMHAPSLVAEQPMSEAETKLGAINRAKFCQANAKTANQQADFYVAMEGGVDPFEHGPATFAYMAIIHNDTLSVGRSANLPLPQTIFNALQAGEELGKVMDRVFNTNNIKQKGGAIGLLTQGLASRESIYTQALVLAMAPFINAELFND